MVDIQENVDLSQYTSFNIGGVARYFVEVTDELDIREALDFARSNNLRFFILSGGTNLLLNDTGFGGLALRIVGDSIKVYKDKVVANSGVILLDLIAKSAESGLTGMENMYGIPGSVGGAVRGNAGAFGTEIKDVVHKVRAINVQTGEVRDFNNKESEFGYRTSYFKIHPEWIVLTVVFKLTDGEDKSRLTLDMERILSERKSRHNQLANCAGSFFKNPIGTQEAIREFEADKGIKSKGGKVPAGWLIDKCGLKGTKVGGAQCSEQQANYIVNTGNATQADVLALRDIIKNRVIDKYNIELEEEVTIII
jgi:UDP-N-acetylmuramate dehydrogenase